MTGSNGKNAKAWTIRIQAPKSHRDKQSHRQDMEKVQRLDGCGSSGIGNPS